MALVTLTVRQALEMANARLTPLQTDARLDSAEQALTGAVLQANNQALSVLRADNTIQAGQRNARAQNIEDKVGALNTVETAHEAEIGIDAFYNALDLSLDAAGAIRLGLPTIQTDISTG